MDAIFFLFALLMSGVQWFLIESEKSLYNNSLEGKIFL